MTPLRIFIGFDPQETVAYHVLAHSILSRASIPVSITPLISSQIPEYTRPRSPYQSTDFSFTRFLVPYLSGYNGMSVFMDCDMLCLTDIKELWQAAQPKVVPMPSVYACPHDYTPASDTKFNGHQQTAYPRKNWSSLMVFDNYRCRDVTPEYVNTASAEDLHRMAWAGPYVGALPLSWNYLVGEPNQSTEPPKIIHFTNGTPCLNGYEDCEYSDLWRRELWAMTRAA